MSNVTDLNELGTEYMVLDQDDKPIKSIRIVWQDEIIASAMGEYNEKFYSGYDDYLQHSTDKLQGFCSDPFAISWYTATEKEFDLHDAMQMAFDEKSDIVIVEIICAENEIVFDTE